MRVPKYHGIAAIVATITTPVIDLEENPSLAKNIKDMIPAKAK